MMKERALTYSLLAHIRNRATLIKGPLDIFVPLIKRTLSKMNEQGIYSGKSISEIKNHSSKLYNIDFPFPVLKNILSIIAKEVNTNGANEFEIYQDGAFALKKYLFTEFEETIKTNRAQINLLESLFKEFCESSEVENCKSDSIFKFIEENKFSLSKYLSNNTTIESNLFTIEAEFVDFFKKFPPFYDLIKNIYLGSLLSSYIEFQPTNIKMKVTLLLDTNFILGLLDLNTPESAHTCKTLIEIAHLYGYSIKILQDTIDEFNGLIKAKVENYNSSFLIRKVYPEDIYNACERRKLSKVDLERISDNLKVEIAKYNISVIYDTSKFKNLAKYSNEFTALKSIRNSERSALHDAMAISYVKSVRGKSIYEFGKVNCWFVNNSITRESVSWHEPNGKQPITIKADDLLNILWLSNPQSNKDITADDVSSIGLASIVSLTLNASLPKTAIIQELDDNIHKYAKEALSDEDIVRLATRITNRQIKDIESFNELAKTDKEEFVKRLEKEANKQKKIDKARFDSLEKSIHEITKKTFEFELKEKLHETTINKIKKETDEKDAIIKKLEQELEGKNEKIKAEIRERFIKSKIKKWRNRAWIEFIVALLVFAIATLIVLFFSGWEIERTLMLLKENTFLSLLGSLFVLLFNGVTIKTLYDRYRNHSNIEHFKNGLKIPNER